MPMYKDINTFGIKKQNFRIVILNLPGLSVQKSWDSMCSFCELRKFVEENSLDPQLKS